MKNLLNITFLLASLLVPLSGSAQSAAIKNMRNKASSLQKEIADKEKILLSSQKDVKSKLDNLNIITARIEEHKALVRLLREEVQAIDSEMKVIGSEIAEQEKGLEKSRTEYAEALRRARKYSNFRNRLLFVLSAEDFNTMVRRYRYAKEYMNAHVVLADSLSAQVARLEAKRTGLEKTLEAKQVSLAQQDAEQRNLQHLESEQRRLVKELQREAGKVQQELKKKRSELKKLNAAIDREIERVLAEEKAEKKRREEAAKKKKPTGSSAKSKPEKSSSSSGTKGGYASDAGVAEMSGSFEKNKKKMPVPITGPYLLVDKFGVKNAVEGKGNVPINTGGITFEGSSGARARCIFDGKVTAVYATDGYSFVLVRHGKYISVYCNLGNIQVKSGNDIKAGDIIGDIVSDAKGGNPRMLFQLRKERKTLNPLEWLKM